MNRFIVDTEADLPAVRDVVIDGLTAQRGHLVRITEVPFNTNPDLPPMPNVLVKLQRAAPPSVRSWPFWRFVLQVTSAGLLLQVVTLWIVRILNR